MQVRPCILLDNPEARSELSADITHLHSFLCIVQYCDCGLIHTLSVIVGIVAGLGISNFDFNHTTSCYFFRHTFLATYKEISQLIYDLANAKILVAIREFDFSCTKRFPGLPMDSLWLELRLTLPERRGICYFSGLCAKVNPVWLESKNERSICIVCQEAQFQGRSVCSASALPELYLRGCYVSTDQDLDAAYALHLTSTTTLNHGQTRVGFFTASLSTLVH